MAFVDYINPEQPGATFTRFPFRAATELVPPAAPHAAFPQVSRPTMLPYQPTFCPRCYSQFNAGYSMNGVCPNCNCSLPSLPPHPHGPPLNRTPATLPIGSTGPGVRPIHPIPDVSSIIPPQAQPPLQQQQKQPPPPLPPTQQQQKHQYQQPRHDVHDMSVDRFMMTSMLDVVNNVLDEANVRDLSGMVSVARDIHLPPNTITVGSSKGPMTTASIGMSNGSPKSKPCQCDKDNFCIECMASVSAHEEPPSNNDLATPGGSFPNSHQASPPGSIVVQTPTVEVLPVFEEEDYRSCEKHPDEKQKYFCRLCVVMLCKTCAVSKHTHHNYMYTTLREAYVHFKPSTDELLGTTQVKINMLDYAYEETKTMADKVAEKEQEAITDAKKIFQAHREALAEREQAIIAQISTIAKLRQDSLSKEKDTIEGALKSLKALSSQAGRAQKDNHHGLMLVTNIHLAEKLQNCRPYALSSNPSEDDSFILKSNAAAAQNALKSLCMFTTAPYPPLCTAMGEGLYHPRVNRLCTVILCTKDRSGEPCLEGGERLFVQLKSITGGGGTLPIDIRDNAEGSYSINFRPRQKGEHQLVIAIRGQHIQGSPFTLLVDGGREYGRFGIVTQVFGSEGSQNSQFCRPWGICCDQQGNIIVGDRSNHRLQVFDSNGVFKHKIGSEGIRPGQFNRPAGVAVTREGHIVVADKDNHRIQVVKLDGTFLFMFGSKGGNDGQMIYPYDVAVNQLDGRIAVTDTGNHRLLIFSHDGILLGKFGYKGYLCGHFDSPRGISFNDDGHIIVSDFNVHHILVIHPDGTTARILGSQGSGNGQFMRPQGIAVDHMGNFVVADTRNNRIVIMHPSGHFIAKFGTSGQSPGQFDRPTSVAVLPDGRIAVVDFGNSRVQVF